jgi:hypothetical protein
MRRGREREIGAFGVVFREVRWGDWEVEKQVL